MSAPNPNRRPRTREDFPLPPKPTLTVTVALEHGGQEHVEQYSLHLNEYPTRKLIASVIHDSAEVVAYRVASAAGTLPKDSREDQ